MRILTHTKLTCWYIHQNAKNHKTIKAIREKQQKEAYFWALNCPCNYQLLQIDQMDVQWSPNYSCPPVRAH